MDSVATAPRASARRLSPAVPRPRVPAGAGRPHDLRLFLAAVPLALVFVIGILLDSSALLTLTALAAIGIALVSPALGLMTLLLVNPIAHGTFLPAPGFPFLLVSAILLGSVYRFPIDRPRIFVPPALFLMVAFVIYTAVQQAPDLLAGYPGELREVASTLIKMLVAAGAVLAAALVLQGRSPYAFLGAMVASAAVVAALAIAQVSLDDVSAFGNLINEPDQVRRPGGSIGNPNYAGFFLAVAAIIAITWFAVADRASTRLAVFAAGAVIVTGLALSASRGAIVTFLAGMIVAGFAWGRRAGLVVTGGAIAAAVMALPVILEQRLGRDGFVSSISLQSQAVSDASRIDAVFTGPELFLASPVFGNGLYRYVLEGGVFSHNYYMTVLAEQGLVGISLWVGMLIAAGYLLARRLIPARVVGFGVFGAFVVGSMFLEPPWDDQTSTMPVVAITAALVANWGASRVRDRRA